MEIKKKKILIDTDNGDDIDDLIAIYFALSMSKQFEIVGIISSFLNAPLRKKQIQYVLKLFNMNEIPCFAGARKPLKGIHGNDINSIYCQYFPFLGKKGKNEEEKAIKFMIEKAKELKEELYIVEIAPQTTLAKAILKDKSAFEKTHIVMMGGCFEPGYAEWNIECDYIASKIVLESGLDLTYVGHDITIQTTLNDPKIENKFLKNTNNEKLDFLVESARAWRNCSKRPIVLHDILAMLSVVDDSICTFKEENISFLEKEGHFYTVIDKNSLFKARIATSVNLPLLYSYVNTLMGGKDDL